jgi:IS30 family transposase
MTKQSKKQYTHFTNEERMNLGYLYGLNTSIREIAKTLNKNPSSISRELNRNKDPVSGRYLYGLADRLSHERRARVNRKLKKVYIDSELEEYVISKLKLDWSPQQISGRMREDIKNGLDVGFSLKECITYQTIYQYIEKDKPELKQYLRFNRKGKYRRKYRTKLREKQREESKKKRIDTRPGIVETRERIGDWEGDTIVGGEKTIHILTNVDRKSGYLLADKLDRATAEETRQAYIQRFNKLPRKKKRTLTLDNGIQFSKHERIEQELKLPIYFAYPYHSWERGTNENTNGLLRQYFPKKTKFKSITKQKLDKVVKRINTRPRKRLGYLTPEEVFMGVAVGD